ncbi:hypothetical protein ACUXV3_15740 [Roseobacteraceae bacterium NS-SX3]
MSFFLGLDAETLQKFGVETVYNDADGVVAFRVAEIEVLSVRHGVRLDGPSRDPLKYVSCLCYTGRFRASDIANVEFKTSGGRERMGYVFPATSFSEPELFNNRWTANFAEVAFRKTVTSRAIAEYSPLRLTGDESKLGELSFDEVFSEEISVLALSVDAIKKVKVSIKELELSLIASGIYPLINSRSLSAKELLEVKDGKYTLRRVSKHFKNEAEHFASLFRRADQDLTGVGAFLTYYQVIEHCISYIMGWTIRELSSSQMDAWKLRDALNEAANEKKRFNKLYSDHTDPGCDHGVFEKLRQSALPFLQALKIDGAENWGWCEAVYKTRNIIVHSQLDIFRAGNFALLGELNKNMRIACLEILVSFSKQPRDTG